jgi:hypothetical protein
MQSFSVMRTALLAAVLLAVACGGRSPDPWPAPRPLGVQEHLAEAERQDAEAQVHEQTASEATRRDPYELICPDPVLADQLTSGGERLLARTPCWSAEPTAATRHRELAEHLRADAAAHRARAAELAAAERRACDGMPAEELAHSPFAHREDVDAVAALVENGRVHGARIRFRPVPGLTVDYLRGAIACHQARAAALGWEPTHFAYDPTLLPGAEVRVHQHGQAVVVTARAADQATALTIYGRAEELLDPAQ